ncbi:MAG: hypothetical protein FWD25_09700, partial [Clostridia bacterium]|nr:hypothetical protein [Clostridia bacterium]
VELLFPVEDPALRARVRGILEREWSDTEKAWVMNAKGDYSRVCRKEGNPQVNSQEALIIT